MLEFISSIWGGFTIAVETRIGEFSIGVAFGSLIVVSATITYGLYFGITNSLFRSNAGEGLSFLSFFHRRKQ